MIMKKIFITMSVIFFAGIFMVLLFSSGLWSFMYLRMTFSRARAPEVYKSLLQRRIAVGNSRPGGERQFSFGSLSFLAPWEEVKITENGSESMRFASGDRVIVVSKVRNIFSERLPRTKDYSQELANMLGTGPLDSDFPYMKASLMATPARLTMGMSKERVQAEFTLLTLKQGLTKIVSGDAVVLFETASVKGFQFGDATGTGIVFLEVFDGKGRHYTISLKNFTQTAVDALLSSLWISS